VHDVTAVLDNLASLASLTLPRHQAGSLLAKHPLHSSFEPVVARRPQRRAYPYVVYRRRRYGNGDQAGR